MDQKKLNTWINNKIELSLCAIMFFAPLIKSHINKNNNITNEEKSFINGFIKLWYINIILIILAITFEILSYKMDNDIFMTMWTSLIIILIISLIIWSILAITEKQIWKDTWNTNTENKTDKMETILNFIPIYNIYIRYKKHNFDWNDNQWIKESIIMRWLFSILLCINMPEILIFIYIWLILLLLWINISNITLWENVSNKIDNLFKKNPEETWWQIIGILISPFNKKTLNENIEGQKEIYSLIYKFENKQILLEFILLIICATIGIYFGIKSKNYELIIWIVLIISRYSVMIIQLKHLTHIPVFKEITSIFFRLQKKQNEKIN